VYWIAVSEVLGQRGLKVFLVDARQMKYVPARERRAGLPVAAASDLMSQGYLRAAFRPGEQVCVVRAVASPARRTAGRGGQLGAIKVLVSPKSTVQGTASLHRVGATHPRRRSQRQDCAAPAREAVAATPCVVRAGCGALRSQRLTIRTVSGVPMRGAAELRALREVARLLRPRLVPHRADRSSGRRP